MKKAFLLVLLTLVITSTLQAQRASYFKRIFVDAEYYLLYEDFKDALPLYLELHNAFPNNANVAYRIGICYLNIPNEKHKSIPFFELAKKNISDTYQEGYFTESNAPKEVYLFLGKAFRVTSNLDKALEAFEHYNKLLNEFQTTEKFIAKKEISSIETAKAFIQNPINVKFTSVGRTVNTRFAEINPVVSADNNTLIYTSAQQFYNAILHSNRRASVWTHPININSQLFADGPISTVGISSNGRTLLLSRNDNDIYNLYSSTLDTTKNIWSPMSKLPKEINTRSWENYASYSPSGDTIVFSSNKPGGAGGFDIYMSVKTITGWSESVNLGDIINTPFDEIAPTISHDGKKLFFSSKGHDNMGGYDIFVSHLKNKKWTKPKNLGYPINTTDDDVFFFPLGDGSKGYISRLLPQSYGESDIYFVEFDIDESIKTQDIEQNQPNTNFSIEKIGQKPNVSIKPSHLLIP